MKLCIWKCHCNFFYFFSKFADLEWPHVDLNEGPWCKTTSILGGLTGSPAHCSMNWKSCWHSCAMSCSPQYFSIHVFVETSHSTSNEPQQTGAFAALAALNKPEGCWDTVWHHANLLAASPALISFPFRPPKPWDITHAALLPKVIYKCALLIIHTCFYSYCDCTGVAQYGSPMKRAFSLGSHQI